MQHPLSTPRWAALVVGLATSLDAAQAADYRFIDLRPAGATSVQVWDVNNLGQVVGTFNSGGANSAFVWQAGVLSPLPGPAGAIGYSAFSLSETGVAVGSFYDTEVVDPTTGQLVPGPQRGWIRDGATVTELNVPDASLVQPRGISPDGRFVAGYYFSSASGNVGFVFDRSTGTLSPMSAPGTGGNIAQGVNAAHQVAGGYTRPGASTGYIYDIASSVFTEVAVPGASSTRLRDLDNRGHFTGWAVFPGAPGSPSETRGIVGSGATLETVMFPGSVYTALQGINDAGWISGSYQDAVGGPFWGFVAIPVPEPGTWALWLGGIGALLAWRSRRQR
jgi:MYXO-CTERM domain-containing protein